MNVTTLLRWALWHGTAHYPTCARTGTLYTEVCMLFSNGQEYSGTFGTFVSIHEHSLSVVSIYGLTILLLFYYCKDSSVCCLQLEICLTVKRFCSVISQVCPMLAYTLFYFSSSSLLLLLGLSLCPFSWLGFLKLTILIDTPYRYGSKWVHHNPNLNTVESWQWSYYNCGGTGTRGYQKNCHSLLAGKHLPQLTTNKRVTIGFKGQLY